MKIDFFNGASWVALGDDPFGRLLFDIRETKGDQEAVGLTTLIQKFLYAGYLRGRDRARIAAACDERRLKEFFAACSLPLTRADLERGRLSNVTRWRLRLASCGVTLASLPAWLIKVVWRKLHFAIIQSNLQGRILVVHGADGDRQTELVRQFLTLLERSGFPQPAVASWTDINSSGVTSRLLLAWRAFAGQTVLVVDSTSLTAAIGPRKCSAALQITLPDPESDSDGDLKIFLDGFSRQALTTLRGSKTKFLNR